MKKITLSHTVKNIVYIALFTLILNASAQASVVIPSGTTEEGGFANHGNYDMIIVQDVNTSEVQSFENTTILAALNQVSRGEYEITVIKHNKKTKFKYKKH